MSNRECIQGKIEELQNVLEEMDRLDETKEKLKKIDTLRALTVEIFGEEESLCGMVSEYTEKEIKLQKLIIKGLTERINDICGVNGVVESGDSVSCEVQSEDSEGENVEESQEACEETSVNETVEDSSGGENPVISDKSTEDESDDIEEDISKSQEEELSNEVLEGLTDQMLEDMKE